MSGYLHESNLIFGELMQNCVLPVYFQYFDAFKYVFLYSIASFCSHNYLRISPKSNYFLSIVLGCLYLLCVFATKTILIVYVTFTLLCYGFVCKKSNCLLITFSFLLMIFLEYSPLGGQYAEYRSYFMIAIMKVISYGKISHSHFYHYFAYVFCVSNIMIGPWISFDEFNVQMCQSNRSFFARLKAITGKLLLVLLLLFLSTCGHNFLLAFVDDLAFCKAYLGALAFRLSHYCICYTSEMFMLLGGYSLRNSITSPLRIELPYSLTDVVVHWNFPIHLFIKNHVFCEINFGIFTKIFLTYLASSALHGLNASLSIILISLGFFTITEYELRNYLSRSWRICIERKPCPEKNRKCSHRFKSGSRLVACLKLAILFVNIGTLTYLGYILDENTSINYWSDVYYWNHLLYLFVFLFCISHRKLQSFPGKNGANNRMPATGSRKSKSSSKTI